MIGLYRADFLQRLVMKFVNCCINKILKLNKWIFYLLCWIVNRAHFLNRRLMIKFIKCDHNSSTYTKIVLFTTWFHEFLILNSEFQIFKNIKQPMRLSRHKNNSTNKSNFDRLQFFWKFEFRGLGIRKNLWWTTHLDQDCVAGLF